MQDPASAAAALQAGIMAAPFPQEEPNLRCPRCDSTNTKFCYYNNYNLSQPRHFCKSCRRYWTKGGALRNIPVGGGTRKSSKRGAPSSSSPSPSAAHTKRQNTSSSTAAPAIPLLQIPKMEAAAPLYPPVEADRRMLDITGSFTSLLASNGHFVNLLESFHAGVPPGAIGPPGRSAPSFPIVSSSLKLHRPSDGSGSSPPPPPPQQQQVPLPENFLGLQADSSRWNGSSGWPDLAIHTPGFTFH